jgi:hypothetical protein
MPTLRRKNAEMTCFNNQDAVGLGGGFIGIAEIANGALHHAQARVNAGSGTLIEMALEDASGGGLFVPEGRGTGMNTTLRNA